jgi:hypothetical protein
MSENGKRYLYRGHAIGVSAQFDRLGEARDRHHVIPALGAAVLPVTGGLSHSHLDGYHYPVEHPTIKSLVSVRWVESRATGRKENGVFRTKVESKIEDLTVLGVLHFGLVEFHLESVNPGEKISRIFTRDNKIENMSLGGIRVHVDLDNQTLDNYGTRDELFELCRKKVGSKDEDAWRFRTATSEAGTPDDDGYYYVSLVRRITLADGHEKAGVKQDQNRVSWEGFGTVHLAEVIVGKRDWRITMARLDMGSPAGGSGSVGDGSTNGSIST